MDQLKKRAQQLEVKLKDASAKLNLKEINKQLAELNKTMAQPDFWQDSQRAQAVSQQAADLARRLEPWQRLHKDLESVKQLLEMDSADLKKELMTLQDTLEKDFTKLAHQLKFQGPYDDYDVIVSVYAGAGGTDAQDFSAMLLRMYLRWAESQKLKAENLDQSSGEEAGIKSATIKISDGDFLYGKLAGEHGVHRLVRLSPFNADHKRQTSFAKIEVLPLVDKPSEAEIEPKDLKIEVFRSGGRGGQSVNTTDSAVRLTHLPTGITVAIQNERSQLQNKETAMNILRSKLVQLQLEQHAASLSQIKGPNQSAEWGNQIRNYVLHPYKQIKDLRSGYESSNPEAVLDGELDPLVEAWLNR